MADRSLKGTGVGSKSFEDENDVEFEPRRMIGFDCPRNHHFSVVFAEAAEMPTLGTCPRCGTHARRTDSEPPTVDDQKPKRTPWDMVRERRSLLDLESLLAERLALLRNSRHGPAA